MHLEMIELEGLVSRAKDQFLGGPTPYERKPFQVEENKPISGRIETYTGHGLQKVGMGKEVQEYPIARSLWRIASEESGKDVAGLSIDGTAEDLNRTENAQIVNGTLSAIHKRIMIEKRPRLHGRYPKVTAGQSQGAYNAAFEAGSWGDPNSLETFRKFARVLSERGKIFQRVADESEGKLVVLWWNGSMPEGSLWPSPLEMAQTMGIEDHTLQLALDISKKQVVLGGKLIKINEFMEHLAPFRSRGVEAKISEFSSGPFHTSLMEEAEQPTRELLAKSGINKQTETLVVANTRKGFLYTSDEIEQELGDITTMPVMGQSMDETVRENCRGIMYSLGGKRTIVIDMFGNSIIGEKKPFIVDKKKTALAVGVSVSLGAGILLGSRALVNKKRSRNDQ